MHRLIIVLVIVILLSCTRNADVPSYLEDFRIEYAENPREANLAWFKEAGYGLFIHYGLYSQLGRGEWAQLRDTIPLAEYAKLYDSFNPENFDAGFITDFVQKAGMKYITITSKHHDGFCLFKTKNTEWNSVSSPARRDLIGELYEQCEAKGIGLFLYYSYAADWKHPYFYSREAGWPNARPAYPEPQPEYLYKKPDDFRIYVDYVHEHLTELMTQYPNIAGIWFDPVMGFYKNPEVFPIDETYALVRSFSPHVLISFKQGANGEEDFMAPERGGSKKVGSGLEIATKVYELNKDKHKEICNTMQPHIKGIPGATWGYNKGYDGKHRTVESVLEILKDAKESNANLLLNIGPKGDGSFPDEDVDVLIEVGKIIRGE